MDANTLRSPRDEQIARLEAALLNLQNQRELLGETIFAQMTAPLEQQLAALRRDAVPAGDLEGERKLVTIVFADISGFTAFSEQHDPEQVRSLVNACFDALAPVLARYGGWIDKFIGDAILALFGAPVANEHHAEQALRAALAMMEALEGFNARQGVTLGLHLGINTGTVIAGGIGSTGQQQYSVIGDAVNLAARLEDLAINGQILVGASTYRLTEPLFEFEPLPPTRVKGKNDPVPVYRLIRSRAAPGTLRGIAGLSAPLVGRDAEFARVMTALDRIQHDKGGIIAIVGEAGLGKSRLVAELRRARSAGFDWAEGRALSYSERMSYWIARDMLAALVGAPIATVPADLATLLKRNVTEYMGESPQCDETVAYLARMLEVPLEEAQTERIRYLLPDALQTRMIQAFQGYLRARAMRRPIVMVWEDLHWADPSSLRLLEELTPMTAAAPVAILLVYRSTPESRVWEFHQRMIAAYIERYEVVELNPLRRAESLQLVYELLGPDRLPDAARRMILDRAEGNPFFLEELVRALLDDPALSIQEGRFAAGAASQTEVPATLQGVITARIDRLAPESKRVLQTAAVIGRVFEQRVLARILRQHDQQAELTTPLDDLQARELIRLHEPSGVASNSGEQTFIFKHALTHETAYHSMLIARRKALHLAAAEAIAALSADRIDDLAATLAHHYQNAGAPARAVTYLTRAADRARATYANQEAIAFYREAIGQIDELLRLGEQPDYWRANGAALAEQLGDVLFLPSALDEAIEAYELGQNFAPPTDLVIQARLRRKIGLARQVQGRYQAAADAYTLAESILGAPNEPPIEWRQEWIALQLERMGLYYWTGDVGSIGAIAEQTRPHIEAYGTPNQRGDFFGSLAIMALRRDRYIASDETVAYARARMAAILDTDHLDTRAGAKFLLGFTYLWHGDLDAAQSELCAALEIAKRIGDIGREASCLVYLGIVARKRQDVAEVWNVSLAGERVSETGRIVEYIGMALGNQAWAAYREGRHTQALELGRRARVAMEPTPQWSMFPWVVLFPLIGATLAGSRPSDAFVYAAELVEAPGQPLPAALQTALTNAITAWRAGAHEAARADLEGALALAHPHGYI